MHEYLIHNKLGAIHCYRWEPDGKPIGIVQIIHGVREHTKRYDGFARYLSAVGFLVVGADHPGHGKTYETNCARGYLAGGWTGAVKNIRKLYNQVHACYPNLPYIMFGHSMGSYLLQTYLSVYDDLSAAVISGTGWQSDFLLSAGKHICAIEAARLGEKNTSELLEKLMFGSYNQKFAPNRTENDWISSDTAVVDAYCADPMCTWKATIQLCHEMLSAIKRNQSICNMKNIRKDIPMFFISGQMDPVGNFGNGVLRTVSEYKNVGINDVTVELYPNMRHECVNEIGKEKVLYDIVDWLNRKCVQDEKVAICNFL